MRLRPLTFLFALLITSTAAAQSAPEVSPPPLVGVDGVEPERPPLPVADDETPVPPAAPEPEDVNVGRRARLDSGRTNRLVFESLGGVGGLVVGVGLPIALIASSCGQNTAMCILPIYLLIPGVAFLPPLGVWAVGKGSGGAGGYWWTMLGSTAGWLAGGLIWSVIGNATRVNDVGAIVALTAVCSLFSVAGSVAAYETSSARYLAAPASLGTARLVPWVGAGRGGLALAAAF